MLEPWNGYARVLFYESMERYIHPWIYVPYHLNLNVRTRGRISPLIPFLRMFK